MKIFSIKDKKIGFENIFIMPNEGAAIRNFGEACKQKDSALFKFPDDFELWTFGSWNQETGEFNLDDAKCIATAKQYAELG